MAPKAEQVPIRILVVDDHAIVREGLRLLLKFDEQLEVVGEAANGREALVQARAFLPDVVLMDLLMPVMDGITATGKIREELPNVEVVALTSVLEDASVVGAIRAGAIGYLLKDTDGKELRRAIKAAAAGQVQLSPEAARRIVLKFPLGHSPRAFRACLGMRSPMLSVLSKRTAQIVSVGL